MTSPADVSSQRPTSGAATGPADTTVRPQPMPMSSPAAAPAPAPQPQATAAKPQAAPAAPTPPPASAVPPAAAAPPVPAPAPAKPTRGPVRRFIRSLFSHLLFAGAAVAAVLGYIYHQPILHDVSNTVCAPTALGQWMDKPASVAATPRPAAVTTAAPAAVATAPVMAPPPLAEDKPAVPAAIAPAAPAPAAAPAAPAAPATPAAPQASTAPSAPASPSAAAPAEPESKPAAAEKPAAAPAKAAAVEAEKPAAPPAAAADNIAPGNPVEALRKGIADAREAYVAGKPEAVSAYAELARRFPDSPDVTGELGNIFYQQGKMAEAGEQFYETALRLVRAKQEPRAACLIDVVRKLKPERARDLDALITATCPVSTNR